MIQGPTAKCKTSGNGQQVPRWDVLGHPLHEEFWPPTIFECNLPLFWGLLQQILGFPMMLILPQFQASESRVLAYLKQHARRHRHLEACNLIWVALFLRYSVHVILPFGFVFSIVGTPSVDKPLIASWDSHIQDKSTLPFLWARFPFFIYQADCPGLMALTPQPTISW